MGATVLVTGSTGFLGKVVLAELLRRKTELNLERCVLLIRGRRKLSARQRFDTSIAPSPCFAELPLGWSAFVDVVQGDLSEPQCGVNDLALRRLQSRVTHVIHCAASVDFDLPVQDACTANITSTLNMLELAKKMKALQAFISTSTAYVTPHRPGLIPEQLAPLKRSVNAMLADIHSGVDQKQLLDETGHANTYTYTKCLAEHLLVQHRGNVPLTIVRPSIISASYRHPTPGWIDSKAAFAGFVVTIGGGLLKVVDANPHVHIDIVPVDHVAQVLIDVAFKADGTSITAAGHPTPIVHAVAGPKHAANIGATSAAIVAFFRKHQVARKPALMHLGQRSWIFSAREAMYHRAPAAVAQLLSTLRRDAKGAKGVRRVSQTLHTINKVFPYFTHHTFAFDTAFPLPEDFAIDSYVQTVCRGAHTHLMRRDRGQTLVAGHSHYTGVNAAARAMLRRDQNLAVRTAVALARGLFARLFEAVTFDEVAFKRALARVPQGHQLVLVPTHRSYLDFLLLPYLLAVRPDLNLAQPAIVAADDFLTRPLLGPMLRRLHAVAMPRAHSQAAISFAPMMRKVADGRPLMVFLEGERSRGRKPLPLREDVLAALKATGKPFSIVPVGISYERIAEETPFLRELKEGLRRPLEGRQLFTWLRRAHAHQVQLGRVHLSADVPVTLDPASDVPNVAARVQRGLRQSTVCTDFHLLAFVRRHPRAAIDVSTLRDAICARGGKVMRTGLRDNRGLQLDPRLEAGTRKQWAALFAWDLAAHYPHCTVLQDLLAPSVGEGTHALGTSGARAMPVNEPQLHGLLDALAQPMVDDCLAVAQALAGACSRRGSRTSVSVQDLLAQTALHDSTLLPEILAVMHARGLLRDDGASGTITFQTTQEAAWRSFMNSCALHGAVVATGPRGRRSRAPAKAQARQLPKP